MGVTRDPLQHLRAALLDHHEDVSIADARLDLDRERRKGVPEVILAAYKTAEQTVSIARVFLDRTGRAIISRVSPETRAALEQAFGEGIEREWYERAQAMVLRRPGRRAQQKGGQVGIITAGTGDIACAEEAALLCREMGCEVHTAYDVGVAGLHRLIGPLQRMLAVPVDVLIVAAGMDGALPSVIAGLVDVPVVGLPTSTGYGMGGQGEAALLAMLQTCAPGLAVVNIDNGIGAGAMAALIANRIAAAREERG